jgi:DNA modification methylase
MFESKYLAMIPNTIEQGDALVEVPKIEDGSIDLIVVDPPYGDNIGYGRLDKKIANNEDETINYKILPILYDKLRTGGYATFLLIGSFHPLYRSFVRKKRGLMLECNS